MIGYLSGRVLAREAEHMLLDVRGVGYEVTAPTGTLENWNVGEEAQVWIYTHLREDQLQLFGFSSVSEKHFFLSLLKVNGVGPKMAIKILSGASLARLIELVEGEDVKGLTALPKVGKKTAEQIILELKGKLVLEPTQPMRVNPRQEVLSALVHLGFRPADVEKAIARMPETLSLEESIRQGLQILTGPM